MVLSASTAPLVPLGASAALAASVTQPAEGRAEGCGASNAAQIDLSGSSSEALRAAMIGAASRATSSSTISASTAPNATRSRARA
jgi:hypothetical protein